jgi:hypothetical protein
LTGLVKGDETFSKDESNFGFARAIKISEIKGTPMENHLFIEGLIKSKVVMDNLKTRMHITAGIRNEGTT